MQVGQWHLTIERDGGDLDLAIRELLEKVSEDLGVWSQLGNFRKDVFCGVFMKSGNDRLDLMPQTIRLLADRGLRLSLDVWGP